MSVSIGGCVEVYDMRLPPARSLMLRAAVPLDEARYSWSDELGEASVSVCVCVSVYVSVCQCLLICLSVCLCICLTIGLSPPHSSHIINDRQASSTAPRPSSQSPLTAAAPPVDRAQSWAEVAPWCPLSVATCQQTSTTDSTFCLPLWTMVECRYAFLSSAPP